MDPDETLPSGDDPPARPPELIGPHPSPPELPGDDDGGRREGEEGARKRKRTKTGCLTCRKRRIKCDERRPICQNCIKSKRSCDGYNQRVIFKTTIGTYSHLYGPVVYPHLHQARHGLHPSLHHSFHHRRHHQHQHVGAEQSRTSPHQAIAPRPPDLDFDPHSHPHHPQAQPQLHHYGPPLFPPPRAPAAAAFPFLSPISDSESSAQFPSPHGPHGSHQFSIVQQQQQQPLSYSALAHHSHGTNGFVRQGQIYAGLPDRLMAPARTRDQLRFSLPDSRVQVLSEPDEEMLSAGESDEEMALIPPRHMYSDLVLNHLEALSHRHSTGMRSFSDFARDGALATYIPTGASSPLNNPTTAAVFAHFVNVTGPSMSLYERHPFDASRVFERGSGSSASPGPTQERAQSIWTYTFPVIAFSHPTVMQAILALGALQIATLSRAPPTAAMKHYHLAIRRLARNVQNRTRRTQPAILAATLLLAYFEVCSADHSKWCNHLYGARNLFREIDLRAMTRAALPLKRMRQHQMEKDFLPERLDAGSGFACPANPDYGLVDVGLLNHLSGRMLTVWDYGQADNAPLHAGGKTVQQIDGEIKEYEDLRDLFWWYAKMDIYQSVLGGTKLFMEYEDWTQCPPRSPIGKADTVYGTYDHLMLLLGRLADFAAVDLARKTKVFRHQGPPGSSPPMFPGMLPTKPKFPTGFSPPRGASPHSEQSDDGDAEAAAATAHREWESIKEAFEVLRSRFGPMFEPLGAEYADRRDSPFGPTLQYRTFSMAGIWLNYYMGLIHLHRTHPSMPPIAMMAAGQAAPVTAFYANEIGRIAAGLADDCGSVTEVSTLAGAAFIESCFCLFVAAVQYQDSEQRRWMIRRMHDIGRLTGWQSARQIADGCESGWIKAYQMGRGPKYERLNEFQPEQSSIWANPRRIDRVIRESADNRLALVRSERAHYALGLLSVEHDLEQLDLKEEPL